jgi:hypothetical protein
MIVMCGYNSPTDLGREHQLLGVRVQLRLLCRRLAAPAATVGLLGLVVFRVTRAVREGKLKLFARGN